LRLRTRRNDRLRLRPALLQLEARQVLSIFLVDKTSDSDARGALRSAINQANTSKGDDTIEFAPLFNTPQTIKLAAGRDLDFNNSSGGDQKITINGPAGGVTIGTSATYPGTTLVIDIDQRLLPRPGKAHSFDIGAFQSQ
jgi:hypothetical protein